MADRIMTVVHSFWVVGSCPENGARDQYKVSLSLTLAPGQVPVSVEKIIATCDELLSQPILQETFTLMLATAFRAMVRTEGTHGGASTTCDIDQRP